MSVTKKILRRLSDLQVAISLLFIIGTIIAFGTFIEQNQSLDFYKKNYPENNPILGFFNWKVIVLFNLNNVYGNFWFILLLLLFTSSLIACTFTTQLPLLRKFRLWKFFKNTTQLDVLPLNGCTSRNLSSILIYDIYHANFHVFRQGKKNYSYSGLLGRVGPILVHISILILAIGTILGSIGGYNVQELVPRGEIFHLQNLAKTSPLSQIPQHFAFRVNDFWITYTKDGKVNQFYSDLSVLNSDGFELKRKAMFVNEPFIYKGITLYQTDWDVVGVKLNLNGKVIQIPLKKVTKVGRSLWLGSINLNSKNFIILLNDLRGEVYLYDEQGILIKQIKIGENYIGDNSNISIIELLTSTGIQVKQDPGIVIVYVSFLLIICSIYISFLSYSQIWGIEEGKNFFVAAKTNREVLIFQESFKTRLKKINSVENYF